jgi:hypothetical protein
VSGEQFVSGAPAQLRLTGVSSSLNVTVESGTGDSYVPDLRRTAGGVVATIGAGYLKSGIYDVRVGGEIIRKVAVNVSAVESDIAVLSPDDARERLSGALGMTVSELDLSGTNTTEIRSHLREARTGVELWNVFMLLALFTMLAEMIVEKKWRPEAA